MRFCSLIIASLFLLSACGNSLGSNIAEDNIRKPKIPAKASMIDYRNVDTSNMNIDEMEVLLDEIEKDIERPNITEDDIRRGWYYGGEENIKYGTPSSWLWVNEGGKSKWISPSIIEETDYQAESILCEETSGEYIVSCIDTEIADCKYIPETVCKCIEDSKWVKTQGCILTDEDGEFIQVSQEELNQGWYKGLPNEKKLDTPPSWIWIDAGFESQWQNPAPK
ncbi:hypothetical protein JW758_05240 [Candidatus Peregrinibacteria bacterium]|nr:hypothetical protein [Candidatus Peregrinibacteria bacterium]